MKNMKILSILFLAIIWVNAAEDPKKDEEKKDSTTTETERPDLKCVITLVSKSNYVPIENKDDAKKN